MNIFRPKKVSVIPSCRSGRLWVSKIRKVEFLKLECEMERLPCKGVTETSLVPRSHGTVLLIHYPYH